MNKYKIHFEGKIYEMDVEFVSGEGYSQATPSVKPSATPSAMPSAPAPSNAQAIHSEAHKESGVVLAPIPSTVIRIDKSVGDAVKAGDIVMILEAMKMENEIISPIDGVIASIECAVGTTVSGGTPLFVVKE